MQKISVVILAKDEEFYLNDCLKQFEGFADEIIYGDMESSDSSILIAEKFTEKIYHFQQTNDLDSTKSKLVEYASGDWVLIVDADEIYPQKLLETLVEIANSDHVDVVKVPFQIYIFGKKIIGLGWQYDAHERFFKKGHVIYSRFHHTAPDIKGSVLNLERNGEINVKHYWVQNWKELTRKLVYYSEGQANKLNSCGIKYSNSRMCYFVIRSFISRYIRSYGFLNGWLGLKISLMLAFDVFLTYMKLEEIQEKEGK